jgi:hypothetical protein
MASNASVTFSRRQVAALLGIEESQVKGKDNDVFHPDKAPDGSLRYSADEVLAVLERPDDTAGGTPSGTVCATAFELFMAGKSLAETVIALKQPPAVVLALRAEFDSMAGCLTVSQATVSMIEKASRQVVRSEEQLLTLISGLQRECEAAYEQGFAEGNDTGKILDPITGNMIPVRAAVMSSNAKR